MSSASTRTCLSNTRHLHPERRVHSTSVDRPHPVQLNGLQRPHGRASVAPGLTAVVHSSSLICPCPAVVLILAKATSTPHLLVVTWQHPPLPLPRSYILTMMTVHIYLDRNFNWDPYHSRPSFTSPGQPSHLPRSTVAIESTAAKLQRERDISNPLSYHSMFPCNPTTRAVVVQPLSS